MDIFTPLAAKMLLIIIGRPAAAAFPKEVQIQFCSLERERERGREREREREGESEGRFHSSWLHTAPRSSSSGRAQSADSLHTMMDEGIVIQHSWAPLGCQAAVSSDGHCSPVGWKSHLYPIEIDEIFSN